MNSEEDEFQRIEAEAKHRAQAAEDDDTQVYTSDVALAEAYRCGYAAGAAAEREACAKVCSEVGANGLVEIKRFAALVAAAERDACAKVAEGTNGTAGANYLIAKAIRARGTT